jgi:hypothetical protein
MINPVPHFLTNFNLDIRNDFRYCYAMLKLSKKHTFYEVWSEDAGESVYVTHKPTKSDVEQIWKENWPNTRNKPMVFKEKHVYITDPKTYHIERGLF